MVKLFKRVCLWRLQIAKKYSHFVTDREIYLRFKTKSFIPTAVESLSLKLVLMSLCISICLFAASKLGSDATTPECEVASFLCSQNFQSIEQESVWAKIERRQKQCLKIYCSSLRRGSGVLLEYCLLSGLWSTKPLLSLCRRNLFFPHEEIVDLEIQISTWRKQNLQSPTGLSLWLQ